MSEVATRSDRTSGFADRAPPVLPSTGWTVPLTTFTAAAMAFLAVLALAASMAAERLAEAWRADLAGVATVRIAAVDGDMEDRIANVLEVLRTTPGIARIKVLSDAEQADLIAPWLGEGTDLGAFPTPQLIDLTLDGAGPDATQLQGRLDLTVSGVVYDDHAAWRAPLAAAARSLEWLALAAAVLILVTAGAVVAFAARATLAANRHVVETVRLVGAEDAFIANAFVWALTRRASIGGAGGALLGCLILMLFPDAGQQGGAGLGISLAPGFWGWAVLLIGVPALCALTAWLSARAAVRITLAGMP